MIVFFLWYRTLEIYFNYIVYNFDEWKQDHSNELAYPYSLTLFQIHKKTQIWIF